MSSSTESELLANLTKLKAEFDREMRARGFDPAQADNVPLTPSLATLHSKLEHLRAELAEFKRKNKCDE